MKFSLITLSTVFILMSCQQAKKISTTEIEEEKEVIAEEKSDTFYHYSVWYAFVNKIFDGNLTAKELKTKGDIGLGSYDRLDGELIMLDGVLYRATEDGKVTEAKDADKIVYANAAFFDTEKSFTIDKVDNYASLRTKINEQLPSKNLFYACKSISFTFCF